MLNVGLFIDCKQKPTQAMSSGHYGLLKCEYLHSCGMPCAYLTLLACLPMKITLSQSKTSIIFNSPLGNVPNEMMTHHIAGYLYVIRICGILTLYVSSLILETPLLNIYQQCLHQWCVSLSLHRNLHTCPKRQYIFIVVWNRLNFSFLIQSGIYRSNLLNSAYFSRGNGIFTGKHIFYLHF